MFGGFPHYFGSTLPYIFASVLPYIFLRLCWHKFYVRSRYRTSVSHELGLFLLAMFLVAVAALTVLPEFFAFSSGTTPEIYELSYNFKPFIIFTQSYRHYFLYDNASYFFLNFFGNILLFFPIFFLLNLLFRQVKLSHTLLGGAALSIIIEVIQFPLGRGTDIDDVWLNTLGALLGYLTYRILAKLAPSFTEKFKVKNTVKPS